MITLFESKCNYVKDDEAASKRIALLESELARKDARIAELERWRDEAFEHADTAREERDAAIARAEKVERERDEARRDILELMGRTPPLETMAMAREAADKEWGPGTGAHLFPEDES